MPFRSLLSNFEGIEQYIHKKFTSFNKVAKRKILTAHR